MVEYLSTQWCEKAGEALRKGLDPETMKFITTSVTYTYNNCSDGGTKFFYMKCLNGIVEEAQVGSGEGPAAEFQIIGNYELFAQLSQGIISSHKALMSGRLKVKGNMVKALKLASLADRINKTLSAIDTKY
ncbi:MAG: SCP2 sterol-binding domain-containing protein [Deltaproteobacteria bacterium]|nr:SCP2 sterol-binding domain-containing protein [Deltaproteobacteria bacterium]